MGAQGASQDGVAVVSHAGAGAEAVRLGTRLHRSVDFVEGNLDLVPPAQLDQPRRNVGWNRLPVFVERHIALRHAKLCADRRLGHAQPVADHLEVARHVRILPALVQQVNRNAICHAGALQPMLRAMKTDSRRGKITAENIEEAKALKVLWDASVDARREAGVLTQEAFGTEYNIGNQSAVGFFLNGKTALSPKAARGFAKGLNCRVADFSPRLARQITALARDFSPLALDLAEMLDGVQDMNRRRQLYAKIVQTIGTPPTASPPPSPAPAAPAKKARPIHR